MIAGMLPLLLATLVALLTSPAPSPLRLAASAFGRPAEIEVRDLPQETAREAIHRAFAEIADVERLADPARADGGLAALNAAAGKGPLTVDSRLLTLLGRASDFCFWSEGAHGPVRVEQPAGLTDCSRLRLDRQKCTAELAEGSRLDLRGFAEGFAVDRAVEILKQAGGGNGLVRIGTVQRGFGAGPAGKGWAVELPQLPGLEEPAGQIYLQNRAVVMASSSDLYVNQRTGKPPQGVLLTVAVTEQAADAQGLAASLFITGPREGQLRLGSLKPRPSVLWFLGSGAGAPLQVDYRWSEVGRR